MQEAASGISKSKGKKSFNYSEMGGSTVNLLFFLLLERVVFLL